jgi:hypothetical protein
MSEIRGVPIGAHVVAAAPLLRAGLKRAALAAGLRVTDTAEAATIGLRSPNTGPTHLVVDVCVDADHVTITLAAVPDPEAWARTLALLRELLDTSS